LSGKKGGQDQLKDLLPQLDQQITSLRLQQKQIVEDFDSAFTALNIQMESGTDALSEIYQQWQGINKQVYEYINAGGDAAKAAEYLSNQLQLIQQNGQNTLDDGEQQAIQDAINLNNLLQQRVQLVQRLNGQVFDLQNADALERTQAGSVSRGRQIQELRQQAKEQLDTLNQQIQTATLKLDAEKKVFNISSDIEALHRRDDELTIKSLDAQLAKYNAIKEIVNSISIGASGLFNSSLSFLQPNLNPIGTTISLTGGLTVYVNVPVGSDPNSVTADSITEALMMAARNGEQVGS
jgi:hypothetical protein